jgi:segregation and condensation protein B
MAFGRRVKKIEPEETYVEPTMDDSAVSLEELSQAYADALGTESIANQDESQTSSTPPGEQSLAAPDVSDFDGLPVTTEGALESILFIGGPDSRSVGIDRILGVFQGMTSADLEEAVSRLNQRYRTHSRSFEIVQERGGYRMQLTSEMANIRERFYSKLRETQLQQSAIDCLALVAYQPGITREDVEKLWGNAPGSTLNFLVRKGLVRVEKVEGKMQYFTTDRFLEISGIESLDDLPREEL